jgi:hypothetical protein
MEYLVIPTVHVDSRRNKHVGGWFRAPEDGLYYMGIHGTTLRANVMSGYLFIDNIAIDEAKTEASHRKSPISNSLMIRQAQLP